uniref:ABC transporter domain-containing protein n=1 Tax=Hyaloperonospora arabidopsidis (strain Emoy2) TaxID=559515 RepID=M4BS99_HYAAE
MTGCSFASGSANGGCDMIDCKCGVGCGATTKTIIEGTFSGKPVKVEVQDGLDEMSVIVEGAPLPLSATCKVAGCEQLGSAPASEIDTAATANADDDSSLTGGAVLAIVACAVLSVSLLLSCMAFCCSFAGTHRSRQEDDLETELLKVNSRSVDTLEFRNVSCFTDGEKQAAPKCILNKISGMVSRGQVLGLLGPSGSGKTTLPNALAAVQNGKSKVSGELLVDGNKVTRAYRRVAAYVQQDDTLYSTLTVRECITYSAQLRLPLSMTDAAKGAMVQRIIEELNLGHVANSRIGVVGGSSSERGIAGGERRRVSIGMELVTSPRILILDEPTSGLDSSSAHSVVKLIKELASHDRLWCSASINRVHDHLYCLTRSYCLASCCTMDPLRMPRDPSTISDSIVLMTTTSQTSFLISQATRTICRRFSHAKLTRPLYKAKSSPFMTDEASESRSLVASIQMTTVEIRVLVVRTAQNILRHRSLLVLHVALSLALALFGGLIFNNFTDDLAGFQNRMGAFYFTLTFFGFASMSSMDVFIGERQIFLRETGAMYYGAFSYFLAKTTLDSIFLRVLPASLFACIFYWIMGLQAAADCFLLFWLTVVLFNVAAGSICLFVGVLATRVGSANLGATVMLLIMLLFGGFLINSGTMPDSVGWLTHLSTFGYAFEILMVNELEGTTLSFDVPGYPAIPVYGEVYLRTLGMDYADGYYDVAALAAIACVLQFLALCFLLRQVPSNHDMVRYDQDDDVTVVGQKEAGHKACGPD